VLVTKANKDISTLGSERIVDTNCQQSRGNGLQMRVRAPKGGIIGQSSIYWILTVSGIGSFPMRRKQLS
jgi:hypothetical protein